MQAIYQFTNVPNPNYKLEQPNINLAFQIHKCNNTILDSSASIQ
jgi:hypothetical protein